MNMKRKHLEVWKESRKWKVFISREYWMGGIVTFNTKLAARNFVIKYQRLPTSKPLRVYIGE